MQRKKKYKTVEEAANGISSELTDEQIDSLLEPYNIETQSSVSSEKPPGCAVRVEGFGCPFPEVEPLKLWLHVQQARECWYFKAKHDYECFITSGTENGPRFNVDKLELHIRRNKDNVDYKYSCNNTSYCNKTDKIFGTSNACGRSRVTATATFNGHIWSSKLHDLN
ncbi:MAG: hypothetical protein COB20_00720 [SAR86 cluster bacterium]|uniref:Uncharacterized protein n=1 Tax=SAR86 cluster bacterium TaxID=2030880 RepID=A0A2A4XIP6_9GAMM|nr:MAG: hypothetical protein COB20_00720 [SAR86 cluster bacterium]